MRQVCTQENMHTSKKTRYNHGNDEKFNINMVLHQKSRKKDKGSQIRILCIYKVH